MKKLTDNSNVLKWVDEIISMTNPSFGLTAVKNYTKNFAKKDAQQANS